MYGCVFQLLHSAKAHPVLSTRQLCYFPVRTLQKVQELGHMGYVDHSTPPRRSDLTILIFKLCWFSTSALNILNLSNASVLSLIGDNCSHNGSNHL